MSRRAAVSPAEGDTPSAAPQVSAPPEDARLQIQWLACLLRQHRIGGTGEGAMKELLGGWQFWAALSACFAALTAIFAKVGIENVNSDFATFIRTIVILVVVAALLVVTKEWQSPSSISPRTYVFLTLSGLATGASWLCYFRALKIGEASRVAPIDKLSVVLVAVFAFLFLGERLSGLHWTGVALIAVGAVVLAIK